KVIHQSICGICRFGCFCSGYFGASSSLLFYKIIVYIASIDYIAYGLDERRRSTIDTRRS
ncbi:hypothetical protein BGZ98_003548, partial [Dissophora globulifera]